MVSEFDFSMTWNVYYVTWIWMNEVKQMEVIKYMQTSVSIIWIDLKIVIDDFNI